jgi:Xaa-Pro aminopeptidase
VTPRITAARHGERLARAQETIATSDAAAFLVGVGPELEWLIGYSAMPLERLTMLVITPRGRPVLVVPRLELNAARAATGVAADLVEVRTWTDTQDPIPLVAAAARAGASASRRLLVTDGLRAAFLLRLQAGMPDHSFDVATHLLAPLRAIKDADEIALLREAAHAADRVVRAIAAGVLVGRTEADVAREVRDRLVAEGHEQAGFWIVGSGPNSASPHHDAGDRLVAAGEPIVLDIGGRLGGYYSDITRTIWVTGGDPGRGPDETFIRLFAAVQAAQAAGRAAVRPGAVPEDIDRAARRVIDEAGFGEGFNHRLGHGIGLEVHEDPYIVEGNRVPLRVGEAFSVEPGVYLDGRYGARIEDIVICGPDGADTLNETTRDLLVVPGV